MFAANLRFYQETTIKGEYNSSDTTKRHNVPYESINAILPDVETAVIGKNLAVPTIYVEVSIKRSWLQTANHIMTLDCDGPQQLAAALSWLKEDDIGSFVIESSPSRYWVICDLVADFKNLIARAKRIPGVDPMYVKLSDDRGHFCLRAMPRSEFLPKFPDEHTLTDPIVLEWVQSFQDWWMQLFPTRIAKLYELTKGLENQTLPITVNTVKPNAPIQHVPGSRVIDF